MKTLDRQKPDVVNQTRSNLFGWRGQFTPEFKPLEFERLSNCGEFAIINRQVVEPGWVLIPSNSRELELATGAATQN